MSDTGKLRKAFEEDAEPYGFSITRRSCAAPEPWSEYEDGETGHRWGGFLAGVEYETDEEAAKCDAYSECAEAIRRG